ncbi:MAG TPA: cytochrome c [Stellaceae bacterium]|nr:cytochrome c [Stellaceae bacterium]
MNSSFFVGIAPVVIILSWGAAASASDGDVEAGKRLSLNICGACHIVVPDQPLPPILNPPATSFSVIANRPSTTADSLRRYIAKLHPKTTGPREMPDPELSDDQVTDVASFVLTLRKAK